MKLVIDANILFAALIKDGITLKLIANEIELYAPELIIKELHTHKDEILRKMKRTESELDNLIITIITNIKIIPRSEFENFIKYAEEICPDENDVDYFALALYEKTAIWSNDKHLKEQIIIRIYTTSELLKTERFK